MEFDQHLPCCLSYHFDVVHRFWNELRFHRHLLTQLNRLKERQLENVLNLQSTVRVARVENVHQNVAYITITGLGDGGRCTIQHLGRSQRSTLAEGHLPDHISKAFDLGRELATQLVEWFQTQQSVLQASNTTLAVRIHNHVPRVKMRIRKIEALQEEQGFKYMPTTALYGFGWQCTSGPSAILVIILTVRLGIMKDLILDTAQFRMFLKEHHAVLIIHKVNLEQRVDKRMFDVVTYVLKHLAAGRGVNWGRGSRAIEEHQPDVSLTLLVFQMKVGLAGRFSMTDHHAFVRQGVEGRVSKIEASKQEFFVISLPTFLIASTVAKARHTHTLWIFVTILRGHAQFVRCTICTEDVATHSTVMTSASPGESGLTATTGGHGAVFLPLGAIEDVLL
mmetsp:Transcript_43121/g.108906  ORF Transcript_43121/g.108906 Transcript_43121/m.108906 type:complete len:393 (-) Transcript_43121:194-1372(-)